MKNNLLSYFFNKKTTHLVFVIIFGLACSDKIPWGSTLILGKTLNQILLWSSLITYFILEIYLQKDYHNIKIYKNKIDSQKRQIDTKNLLLFRNRAKKFKYKFDNFEIDSNEFWAQILSFIHNAHCFSSTERSSIYKIVKNKNRENIKDDRFTIIGRYSSNPEYTDTRRKNYSANSGVIGKAYRNGGCYENRLPEYAVNSQKYENIVNKEYCMSIDSIRSINMKSRTYGAFVVKEDDDIINEFIIVFESMNKETDVFNQKALSDIVKLYKNPLTALIKEIQTPKPSLNYAEESGF